MTKKMIFVGLLVAMSILATSRVEAKSIYDQLQIDRDMDDRDVISNSNKQQSRQQSQFSIERAIDYAVELGCKNLDDMILLARANYGLEPLDMTMDSRIKKASPKHTPRFGRK